MRVAATVNYHIHSAETQAFHFDVDGIAGKLVSPELLPMQVKVRDVRNSPDAIDFNTDGILFAKHVTRVQDFGDAADWEADYDDELRALLAERIDAREVILFDHTVRIDDPDAERKPARNVHNDYSAAGARQRLIDILGQDRAREFRAGHYAFVNVWRPIEQPIRTSPLGFIRPASVSADDWMTIDLVYPDRLGQILGVAANEDHDWFYLSQMTPQEVAIFNIYDNQGRPFLGHSALDLETRTAAKYPRKSIESRALVRYR